MIGTKYIPITREEVEKAFKRVKSNGGSAGIDEQSIHDYEAKLDDNLYKLWNRLASGSYFPPSVKEVEIPKKDGKMRKLGIPTVRDRIAQTVIKERIEPIFEKEFHSQSYGYRPGKSGHQAIAEARKNCWQYDWIVDLDIKGFFDNIDHNLLMLAIDRHITEKWVKMYLKRWLEMPTEMKNGEVKYRDGKGTPQGGVVSPLLANLFLHYVFDKWVTINYPTIKFERYADDIIVHCVTQEQAEMLLESIRKRMSDCKLELRDEHIKNALIFRQYRRSLFVNSESMENAFEIQEGLAEYTGTKLGTKNDIELKENLIGLREIFWDNESYVRTFGYFSGFIYAYLLDQKNNSWRINLKANDDLGLLVKKAYKITNCSDLNKTIETIKYKYNFDTIYNYELSLQLKKNIILNEYRDKFTNNKIIIINLEKPGIGFNPNNLQPLDSLGIVYPFLEITDNWGFLKVSEGGCLVSKDWKQAIISVENVSINIKDKIIQGIGWVLKLNDTSKIVIENNNYRIMKN